MSKKLNEYTLGEMKEICVGPQFCVECIFFNRICQTGATVQPRDFNFSDKISFTDEECLTARELIRCFGEDAEVIRDGSQWYVNVGASLHQISPVFKSLLGWSRVRIRLEDILRNKVEL